MVLRGTPSTESARSGVSAIQVSDRETNFLAWARGRNAAILNLNEARLYPIG
jgi:hypothetical protein